MCIAYTKVYGRRWGLPIANRSGVVGEISQSLVQEWIDTSPVIRDLVHLKETLWFNERYAPCAQALTDPGLDLVDVDAASERLQRFAPYLATAFPETSANQGVIESPLRLISNMQHRLNQRYGLQTTGKLLLKMDNDLPISGSIKARGGIYEVLTHAETLALEHGLLKITDDYRKLASEAFQRFFSQYRIAVGSTGNLGLSIGIMGAQLGFQVTVHMSADAKPWKKTLLRHRGVEVMEYASDYSLAVAQGREQAASDPRCHFVDDENSTTLFLGYAVAAQRLRQQLDDMAIAVDAQHPLFVYLPCGVGGAPGGVSFGLKLMFGDHVHCIFAEPTHAPCMLLGVHTGLHEAVSVQDFGLDNETEADGLAVGRPSGFVGRAMQRLIAEFYTADDDELYALLALLADSEQVRLEPSAVAGVPGIARLQQTPLPPELGLSQAPVAQATHIAWATGGRMVPEAIMDEDYAKGQRVFAKSRDK